MMKCWSVKKKDTANDFVTQAKHFLQLWQWNNNMTLKYHWNMPHAIKGIQIQQLWEELQYDIEATADTATFQYDIPVEILLLRNGLTCWLA